MTGPGDYAALGPAARPGVNVAVDDDDEQGILIDADPATSDLDAGPLALHEQPGHANNAKQYAVRLATEPTDVVTVSIESGDRAVMVDNDSTPRTRALTFTTTNWSAAQTVTATAAQDDDASGERVAIAHAASGGDYRDVSATLTATTVDDDAPALLLATSTLAASGVTEGSTATYTVQLATEPTGTVTVTATATATATARVEVDMDGGQAGVQSSLRFDAANWSVPRTATVRGLEDDDARGRRGDAAAHGVRRRLRRRGSGGRDVRGDRQRHAGGAAGRDGGDRERGFDGDLRGAPGDAAGGRQRGCDGDELEPRGGDGCAGVDDVLGVELVGAAPGDGARSVGRGHGRRRGDDHALRVGRGLRRRGDDDGGGDGARHARRRGCASSRRRWRCGKGRATRTRCG